MAELITIEPDAYHQLPGFSSTIAKELIDRSPLHAWQKHPLYGAKGKSPTKAMDRGTAGHTMVLGKGKRIACLPYDDWRTKAAKESRANTRAAGLVPILHEDYTAAEELAANVLRRLVEENARDERVPDKFDGVSEQAMLWHEDTESGPVACRGMMDHLWVWHNTARILDLKFVEDASPKAIERSAENMGYALQSAAYTSGLSRVFPLLAGRIQFLFLFIEVHAPYAINLVEPDGTFQEIGDRRWRRSLETWARCEKNQHWPAYGDGIKRIAPPPWALNNEGYISDER
jgi:hypothetical protein